MTLAQKVSHKVAGMPLDRQIEVLKFIESLECQPGSGRPLRDPAGLLADQPSDLTLEEFNAARREMWSTFPRELPDE
jgi:hypothetical protein